MIDLGPHSAYILGAYGFVAIVSAALIVFTLIESNRQKVRLAKLEQERAAQK